MKRRLWNNDLPRPSEKCHPFSSLFTCQSGIFLALASLLLARIVGMLAGAEILWTSKFILKCGEVVDT
jgi:hypothetical protein